MPIHSSEDYLVPHFARGLRVLLVDENGISLLAIESVLEDNFYKVKKADSASTALRMIEEAEEQFDLAMVDINMTEMNISSFLHRVEHKRKMPVILTYTLKDDMVKALRVQSELVCFLLQKPIPKHDLITLWCHVYKGGIQRKSIVHDRKRKAAQGVEGETSAGERKRKNCMTWTPALRNKFMEAVARESTPSSIMNIMNEPNLKYHHVAYYLQKFRRQIEPINAKTARTRSPHPGAGVGAVDLSPPVVPQYYTVERLKQELLCSKDQTTRNSFETKELVTKSGNHVYFPDCNRNQRVTELEAVERNKSSDATRGKATKVYSFDDLISVGNGKLDDVDQCSEGICDEEFDILLSSFLGS